VTNICYDKIEHEPTNNLLMRQINTFPGIIKSLLANDAKKVGHWAWWVWPTEMPGKSEPSPETYCTKETAGELLHVTDLISWIRILNIINDKLDEIGGDKFLEIIPSIDHGRIHYFLQFWLHTNAVSNIVSTKYPDFESACMRFENHYLISTDKGTRRS
jgi:hypothetical protein